MSMSHLLLIKGSLVINHSSFFLELLLQLTVELLQVLIFDLQIHEISLLLLILVTELNNLFLLVLRLIRKLLDKTFLPGTVILQFFNFLH